MLCEIHPYVNASVSTLMFMEFKGKLWNFSFLGLLVHELKTGLIVIYYYEGNVQPCRYSIKNLLQFSFHGDVLTKVYAMDHRSNHKRLLDWNF